MQSGPLLPYRTADRDSVGDAMTANLANVLEPSLPEILADPIVQALMASDGVEAARLEDLLQLALSRSGNRTAAVAASGASRCPDPGYGRRHGR
jgi:hypothetical protein